MCTIEKLVWYTRFPKGNRFEWISTQPKNTVIFGTFFRLNGCSWKIQCFFGMVGGRFCVNFEYNDRIRTTEVTGK